MSRFHANVQGRGAVPGSGLSGLAQQDHCRDLKERQSLRCTPLAVDGVHYLGWAAMPPHVRRRFLAGEIAYRLVRPACTGRRLS